MRARVLFDLAAIRSIADADTWWAGHGPTVVTVGVTLGLACQWTAIALFRLPPNVAAQDAPVQTITAPDTARNASLAIGGIVAAHLFGRAASAVPDGQVPLPTTLPLTLAGVIAFGDSRGGFAIIGPPGGATSLYPVGGILPGGARLHAVFANHVVLARGPVLESLRLPATRIGAGMTRLATISRRAAAITSAIPLLAGIVVARADRQDDQLNGYRFYPGGPTHGDDFARLGLQPGDLVNAIDGATIADGAAGVKILQTLDRAERATLRVVRGSGQQDIAVELRALASEVEQQRAEIRRDTAAARNRFGDPPSLQRQAP